MVRITSDTSVRHSGFNDSPDAKIVQSSSSVSDLNSATAVRARRLPLLPIIGQGNDIGGILSNLLLSAQEIPSLHPGARSNVQRLLSANLEPSEYREDMKGRRKMGWVDEIDLSTNRCRGLKTQRGKSGDSKTNKQRRLLLTLLY